MTIRKIKKIDLQKPYITNEIKNEIIEKTKVAKTMLHTPYNI